MFCFYSPFNDHLANVHNSSILDHFLKPFNFSTVSSHVSSSNPMRVASSHAFEAWSKTGSHVFTSWDKLPTWTAEFTGLLNYQQFFYIFSFLFLDDKLRCEKQVPYICNMSNVCIYIYISWWTATLKLIGFCQLYIQYTLTTIRGGQCNRNIPHHVFVHRFAPLLMFLVGLFHSELRVCQLNHHKARPWQL